MDARVNIRQPHWIGGLDAYLMVLVEGKRASKPLEPRIRGTLKIAHGNSFPKFLISIQFGFGKGLGCIVLLFRPLCGGLNWGWNEETHDEGSFVLFLRVLYCRVWKNCGNFAGLFIYANAYLTSISPEGEPLYYGFGLIEFSEHSKTSSKSVSSFASTPRGSTTLTSC